MAGGRPAEPRTSPALLERRRLAFLFGDYLLAGELLLPRGVRLSDFLSQAKPFQTLKEAGLHLLAPDRPLVDPDPLERFPFLTVNLRLAEGWWRPPGRPRTPGSPYLAEGLPDPFRLLQVLLKPRLLRLHHFLRGLLPEAGGGELPLAPLRQGQKLLEPLLLAAPPPPPRPEVPPRACGPSPGAWP